jgi:hypothetical protein
MTTLLIIILAIAILGVIVYNWIGNIDYMQKNHPDYKGKDLFGEDVDTK